MKLRSAERPLSRKIFREALNKPSAYGELVEPWAEDRQNQYVVAYPSTGSELNRLIQHFLGSIRIILTG